MHFSDKVLGKIRDIAKDCVLEMWEIKLLIYRFWLSKCDCGTEGWKLSSAKNTLSFRMRSSSIVILQFSIDLPLKSHRSPLNSTAASPESPVSLSVASRIQPSLYLKRWSLSGFLHPELFHRQKTVFSHIHTTPTQLFKITEIHVKTSDFSF